MIKFIACILFQICFFFSWQVDADLTSALTAVATGAPPVDPTSMDAEKKLAVTTDASVAPNADPNVAPATNADSGASGTGAIAATGFPDLEFLWNCKRNPSMGADKCASAMQFFCAGRCTRLNCAVLTNRSICLDVCGSSNPMMEPCVAAGKRNPAIAALGQNFQGNMGMMPPGGMGAGMYPSAGMYSPMASVGMDPSMAGAAVLGGAAVAGVGALAAGVGSLLGGKKKKGGDNKPKAPSPNSDTSDSTSPAVASDGALAGDVKAEAPAKNAAGGEAANPATPATAPAGAAPVAAPPAKKKKKKR